MMKRLHWLETMMTYDVSNKILFSGDAFGGFGTLNNDKLTGRVLGIFGSYSWSG